MAISAEEYFQQKRLKDAESFRIRQEAAEEKARDLFRVNSDKAKPLDALKSLRLKTRNEAYFPYWLKDCLPATIFDFKQEAEQRIFDALAVIRGEEVLDFDYTKSCEYVGIINDLMFACSLSEQDYDWFSEEMAQNINDYAQYCYHSAKTFDILHYHGSSVPIPIEGDERTREDTRWRESYLRAYHPDAWAVLMIATRESGFSYTISTQVINGEEYALSSHRNMTVRHPVLSKAKRAIARDNYMKFYKKVMYMGEEPVK